MGKTAPFSSRTRPRQEEGLVASSELLFQRPDVASHSSNETKSAVQRFADLADIAARIIEKRLPGRSRDRRWIVREVGSTLELFRLARGVPETIARMGDDDDHGSASWRQDFLTADIVELRIDPAMIVRQRFVLPAESRPFAAAIVEHRLERLTPWKVDDVVYGYRVRPGRSPTDPIEIDFAATSRDIVNLALRKLSRLGRSPTAIGSAADSINAPLTVDLLEGAVSGKATRRRQLLRCLCLIAFPTSLAIFIGTTAWQALAQNDFDVASGALDVQRRIVQSRLAGEDPGQSVGVLLASKTLDSANFALIDRLARSIPDGTFLTEFHISPTAVHLKGRSANAPALVPILEGEAGLKNVRFESPVIREANGGDRFDIIAVREASAAVPEGSKP
ncbi:PilN domain-containing protein [Aureimonas sp. AU40]|uniref:PilN domain-containing protein n=1 Tax=Aureimonas sp. AU40 TaxID=1637747 RepID=UPI000AA632FD|nr:PilN domain-containing protein [Aureimonas sp. AU40]